MSCDSAVSIAWDVLKIVAVPLQHQLSYFTSSRTYDRNLREEVAKLKLLFDQVRNAMVEARNNLGIVYDSVTYWQANAETTLMEAQHLLRKFEEAAKTCCYRTLPEPSDLYQFSSEAEDKIEEIQRLLRIGANIEGIYFTVPVTGIEHKEEVLFESRASIMLHIMDALADDSKSVVGVYGMGGVGKSTLLSSVERIIRKQGSFDVIAKADLLGKREVTSIQGAIANQLSLTMPNIENDVRRADFLRSRLDNDGQMNKKVLIILDNLSEKLHLDRVGIPCEPGNKVRGCKLLLSSRDRNVLTTHMRCESNSVFRLPKLDEKEAKKLFETKMGERAHHDDVKPFVAKALHKCAGLPFLIVEMANHFTDASEFALSDALNQIDMCANEGIGKIINEKIQSSYDRLEGGEVKSFLRLCVVYGVAEPKRENLVRYGVGYALVSEYNSMRSARNRVNTLIKTLQDSSLSLDRGDADSFKIHDLVHKFVALVASRDDHILLLKHQDNLQQDKLKSCRAICIPDTDAVKLPEELNCPDLLIFLLFSGKKSLEVSDSYFNYMSKLKVLNLTGIRLTRSRSHLPSPFRLLDSLQTLCLDECSFDDVSILGELKKLQILSLVNSKIDRLPTEIGQLTELRLLDLSKCSQLKTIVPDVLGRLTKLEELYLENSFDQWDPVHPKTPRTNASLTELKNMPNLCTLHVSILNLSVLPKDLEVEKLKEYKIQIGDVSHLPCYKESKTLMIKANPGRIELWDACIQQILDSTDYLYLDGLDPSVRTICKLSQEDFQKLKHLWVENSPSVHYILLRPSVTYFKTLESLILKNLLNLEKICKSRAFSESFNSLQEVQVESCDKIKVLFPFPLARQLPQLKEIRVLSCESMQKIVEVNDCGKVEFPNLRVLELRELPDIENFFSAETASSSSTSDGHVGTQVAFFYGQQVLIPSLESLIMVGLPNFKEIWSDDSSLGLAGLQSLEVVRCKSLSKVINFGSLVKLRKLRTLKVARCDSVHAIFDLDESSANENGGIPFMLDTLCLEELSSLRRIWSNNPCGIVRFDYLKQLKVSGCDNLKFIFFPSMVKSLAQLGDLTIQNCKIMEAIIAEEEEFGTETSEALAFPMLTSLCFERLESLTCFSHGNGSRGVRSQYHIKSPSTALFNGEVAFPRLETMKITGMDNIEMIWDSRIAADSFPALKSLCVDECRKLVNIGPSCILRWLCNLEKLEAKACGSAEVVFKLQQLNSLDGNDIASFRLRELKLIELPELKSVWDEELFHEVNFQCPRSVGIFKCESLTSLFPASMARDLMQLEESEINEWGNAEIIEDTSHASHWLPLKTLEEHGCDEGETLALQPENKMSLRKQPPVLVKKKRHKYHEYKYQEHKYQEYKNQEQSRYGSWSKVYAAV
ncbi:probable disease resistance protein At4g27220 [Rhodamnia argentea]|uniref:Probable disease resistance protein At4g27220 n=1 Tax=Rhodamnia argentea TaxID=178133 RepID=A0A8B8PSH9_9MYRT|nr:probable disease resistance protein At4g27220 [Rhodamnia argentea]